MHGDLISPHMMHFPCWETSISHGNWTLDKGMNCFIAGEMAIAMHALDAWMCSHHICSWNSKLAVECTFWCKNCSCWIENHRDLDSFNSGMIDFEHRVYPLQI